MKLWHSEPAMVRLFSPIFLLASFLVLFSAPPLWAECKLKNRGSLAELCDGSWSCVWRGTAPACAGECEIGEVVFHKDSGVGEIHPRGSRHWRFW